MIGGYSGTGMAGFRRPCGLQASGCLPYGGRQFPRSLVKRVVGVDPELRILWSLRRRTGSRQSC